MKAITTKFHGPTNSRGSRYSASDEDGNRVTLSADYALNSDDNHDAAARALCLKMNWTRFPLASGGTKTGKVYVFVYADDLIEFTAEEKAESNRKAELESAKRRRAFTAKYSATGGTMESRGEVQTRP